MMDSQGGGAKGCGLVWQSADLSANARAYVRVPVSF